MGAHPQILLGNLGMADSLILMVLALVVFGPRRLPQIGRQIGKLMYEFRKASNDFKFQMEEELRISEDAERRKKEEAERARNLALNAPAQTVEAQADIGAVEQASVSAQPPQPALNATNAEATIAAETQMRYPRINPPSTGEPIAAARPHAAIETPSDSVPDPTANHEANFGAEPAPTVAEPSTVAPQPPADSASDPASSEAVSHHG
jgi:sec-independent protein translocase protein TatB